MKLDVGFQSLCAEFLELCMRQMLAAADHSSLVTTSRDQKIAI